MHESASSGLFSAPVLVYLGMGLVSARILLEQEKLFVQCIKHLKKFWIEAIHLRE